MHDRRKTGAWVDFTGGVYVYAVYHLHSEGKSVRNEELREIVWKPMIRVRYSWVIGCDVTMEAED